VASERKLALQVVVLLLVAASCGGLAIAAQAPTPVPCAAVVAVEGQTPLCYPKPAPTPTPPPACVPQLDRGVVVDKCAHPMTAAAELAVGESRIDAELGGKVTRITAVPKSRGANAIAKPVYSTMPAWTAPDANGKRQIMFWVREDGWYLAEDEAPHKVVKKLPIGDPWPSDIEHLWPHRTRRVIQYTTMNGKTSAGVAGRQQLVEMDIDTGAKTVLVDFTAPACSSELSLGNDPSPPSADGSILGLECIGTVNGQPGQKVKLSFDVAQKKVLGYLVRNTTPNAPSPTHSGKRFYFDGQSWNQGLTEFFSMGLAVVHEHSGNVTLRDGSEWYVAPDFSGSADRGNLVMTSLDSPGVAKRVVLGPAAGYGDTVWSKTHVSCLAYDNPGWCAVSIVGNPDGQGILSNEIVFVDLNPGGKVYRMAHHRSAAGEAGGEGYWGEPHVVISPDGTKAIFGSDLGKSIATGGSVDTYLVEFP
jgi:hypothetical protein